MKKSTVLMAAAVLAAVMTMPGLDAYAADQIERVSIRVDAVKQEPGTVWIAEPVVNNREYSIEDYEWSTGYENWEPGKKLTLTVYLESSGKSFKKTPSVSAGSAEFVSATRTDSTHLRVRVNYIPRVTLQAPENIFYEDEYLLTWDKVDYAGGYEVQVLKDGRNYRTLRLSGRGTTEADLSEYATDDSLVTVKLRATAPSGKGSYIGNSEWVDFDDEAISVDGDNTAYGKFTGNGANKRFFDQDAGNKYSTGWQYINGYWYYFRPENGYAVANDWAFVGNYWYLFDAEGRMLTGWQQTGGYWYFLNSDTAGNGLPYGAMKTGWILSSPSSPYYWLNDGRIQGIPYGAMLANGITPDGFYVNAAGEWRQ